ncbi:hypothetical protein [Legionella cincinnatiensis]|uniref:Dot/Icm T4SS effector n=1 Tax=Legionella cincinnatiensis TaxID=28085 RepID=A0A378IHZ6_9GAMM|nr:hypothetical protein [Legionella cincinnatiensis]KTC83658.1 Dot/Icm T4SS effector [Legionella cincinnatiensis]STX34382.1 Dot/Icm secretion system substrate [Legionella cincinnatiensis]
MAIRVTSFDFDGCLFHRNYVYSDNKDVIASNKIFLDTIKEENQNFTKAIALIGSNRQSLNIDIANSPGKGSCFPAIKKVTDHLGCTFDPFLLADIYGNLPNGTSYDRAMHHFDHTYSGDHSDWIFDDTKASLIYAQMHKVALDHPTEEIIFDFYDDRGFGARSPKDILEDLHEFFTKNPALIPPNVTLRLNHYAGGDVSKMDPIKGKPSNIIDANYQQTVKDMAEVTKQKDTYNDGITAPIFVAHHVKADELLHRKAFTQSEPSVISNPLPEPRIETPVINQQNPIEPLHQATEEELSLFDIEFTPRMVRFYEQLEVIEKKAAELRAANHIKAAETAEKLHEQLYKGSVQYFNNRINDKQFSILCHQAIEKARPELETHRGWKQILGNLALAIIGLGIGYVAAGLINLAFTKHFLFFNTDSGKKLNDMEKVVNQTVPVVA